MVAEFLKVVEFLKTAGELEYEWSNFATVYGILIFLEMCMT